MARIDKLLRAQKAKNNEFYTRYEDVEFFIENSQIKDYLKDKVVYLPCDTEESNIYKYLVNNKERLQIKEILRTSDDYYSHQDLYDKCDVTLTNPPFTGIKKWLKWLDDQNIKYISWFPMMGLYSANQQFYERNKFIAESGSRTYPECVTNTGISNEYKNLFYTPDGSLKGITIFIISNDDYFDNFEWTGNRIFKKTFEEVKDKLFKLEDGYEVPMCRYIPNDYFDGYLYITITSYIGRQKYFDYFGSCGVVCKDGKARPRIKVKLKADEINKLKESFQGSLRH